MSLIQTLLTLSFGVGAHQIRVYRFPASFSCGNVRLRLINPGKRLGDPRILQLALAAVVYDGGAGCLHCCSGLVNLRSVVIVLQFHNEVAFVYWLKVGHMHCAYDASHLGAQRRDIAADVSIISYLYDLAALPRIPVTSDGDENCHGERHNKEGSQELFPSPSARRSGCRLFAFWRQRLRHGGGGVSRY